MASNPSRIPRPSAPASGDVELLERLADARRDLLAQVGQRIVGQREVLDGILTAIFSGGHALLVGVPGPVFANIVLADEVNRTPPKTQAALLQAMQEHQVSAAGQTHHLPAPFFVLATQNPIEQEGTYPLPEAQLDRFMFELRVDYPSQEEEEAIVAATTGDTMAEVSP